jgi:septation ring formation regulator EzrA
MRDPRLLQLTSLMISALAKGASATEKMFTAFKEALESADSYASFIKQIMKTTATPIAPAPSYVGKTWEEVYRDFTQLLKSIGWVPASEYEQLRRENEKLKKELHQTRGTLAEMRKFLKQQSLTATPWYQQWTELMEQCARQNQRLFNTFRRLFWNFEEHQDEQQDC